MEPLWTTTLSYFPVPSPQQPNSACSPSPHMIPPRGIVVAPIVLAIHHLVALLRQQLVHAPVAVQQPFVAPCIHPDVQAVGRGRGGPGKRRRRRARSWKGSRLAEDPTKDLRGAEAGVERHQAAHRGPQNAIGAGIGLNIHQVQLLVGEPQQVAKKSPASPRCRRTPRRGPAARGRAWRARSAGCGPRRSGCRQCW